MTATALSSAASSPSVLPNQSSASTSPTSLEDNADILSDIRLLIQYVSRAFYEVRHILLFEQLIRKEAMKDDELALRLGVTPKEVAKAANQLIRDQLVSVYLRAEVKPGAHKATQRTYYYIDYKHCVDVIKWRMWKMSKVLDDKQRNVIDGQGYVCPRCKTTYSTLDISGLAMTATSFLCEICNTPLNDNENDVEVQKNKDRMRLNSQTLAIKQCLQKADKVVIPAFDIASWVAINMPLEKPTDASDGLAVATGGSKETAVTVELAQEGDMEAKRRLKEEQAEAKRQANAPVWISQSTVNGELTRAGVRDSKVISESSHGVLLSQPSVDPHALAPMFDDRRSPADSNGSITSPSQSRGSSISAGTKRPRYDQQYSDGHYSGTLTPPKAKVGFAGSAATSPEEESEDQGESKTMILGGKLIELSKITPRDGIQMTSESTIYGTLMLGS
ncbi:transcription initiation factor TFIIE alpha subunit [Phakopsora pachyrhizi]|nr:transcription initiation factor TFIIE alpha subunit [Phakopsora pachyrhizi]